ncbi:MAG TPA: CHC2 zinc finger domain-containing protein [Bryobacteraceae bacterium]
MPRIPEQVIERLKHEVSLERLAEARGVKLTRHGAVLTGLCPFHEDHEPSLVISPSKNLWHCLGACQAGGTVIDWVMRAQGIGFRHAVELLRAEHPSLLEPAAPVKQSTVRKLAPPVDRDTDDGRLLAQVVAFYHETLKQAPEALAYLQKRGLESEEMISRFQLGYAQPHTGLSPARVQSHRWRGAARPPAEAGHPARKRSRALQRLDSDSGLQRCGRSGGDLRPQDSRRPQAGHACAPLPAGPASWRVE